LSGQIFINENLLNSAQIPIDLKLLLKFYFHEFGHKIDHPNMALRNRAAQFFEDQIGQFLQLYNLDDGSTLDVFSVPARHIESELSEVPVDQPQPSNLILVEREGRFIDLTSSIVQELEQPSSVVRSLWAEVNRWIFAFLKDTGQTMDHQIRSSLEAMQPGASVGLEDVLDFMNIKELRVLEIQDVESVTIDGELVLNLKAMFTISNVAKNSVAINFKGFESLKIFPAPLNIAVRLSKNGEVRAHVGLRPSVEYTDGAEVKSVLREAMGDVQQLKVLLTSQLRPPIETFLVVDQGSGYRMFPAGEIKAAAAGQWMLTFPIPLDQVERGQAMVAEAVFLGSHRSVYLNRLVQMTRANAAAEVTAEKTEILENSVGIWGRVENRDQLVKKFDGGDPVLMMEGVDAEYPVLNPANIPVQFEVEGPGQVVEVRSHFQRMASIMDLSEEAEPRVDLVRWGDLEFPISTGGTIYTKRDYYEILSASGKNIVSSKAGAAGRQTIRAHFKAPWLPIRDLRGREAYMIPLVHPVLVEAVLSNGDVISYTFNSSSLCVNLLEGRAG